jgi:hypothetical protein
MNETVMAGELEQPQPLSRAERRQLTNKLGGPCAVLGLVLYCLLRSRLPLSVALVLGILLFFLFATWVARLTVRWDFTGFRLLVIRGNAGEGTRTMSYRESLSVAWLICWRSSLFFLPLVAALLLLPQENVRLAYWVPLGLAIVSEHLILYVWIVEAALGKSYSGFSIRLDISALKNA